MPGIVVFGRRWAVGSDDFVFPAAGEIFLRAAWLTAVVVVFIVHNDDLTSCTSGYLVKTYYVGMVTILPLSILFSSFLMYFSMQGTITNVEPRKHVSNIIILKLIVFAVEIAWMGIGTYWAFAKHQENCSPTVVNVGRGTTIVGWILMFLLYIGIMVVFDPLGSSTETPARLQRLWKLRCKLLCYCCCVRSNSDNESATFEDVAELIAQHFAAGDFVVTDVAAAMILVARQQAREAQQRLRSGSTVNQRIPYGHSLADQPQDSMFHPKEWMSVSSAASFMKYALASYGWMYFVYDNNCSGPVRLWCHCKCCYGLRRSDNIHGDNCCGCSTSAILEQTLVKREDIFYANFHDEVYEIPFYIVMDHEKKAVVVSIRGTLSFKDTLTDMVAGVEQMSVEGVPEAKAHRGILRAAEYVEKQLSQQRLLDEAFSNAPDYDLVLVGHSLGAGAAAILAILLKPKYPNLKCFAYSPPGWSVSLSLSRYVEEFVCTVVVGKDFVSRLGIFTVDKLKEKMMNAVMHSDKPKYQILAGSAWRTLFQCRENIEDDEEHDVESASHSEAASSQPLIGLSSATQRRSYTEDNPDRRIFQRSADIYPLYLPGHVLFLEETRPDRGLCETATYAVYWMKPESFDEILVSGLTMLHDHMPNVVYTALNSLVQDSHTQTNVII